MISLLSKVAWLFMQPDHFLSQNVLIHCRVRIKTVGISVVANIAAQLGIVGWLCTYITFLPGVPAGLSAFSLFIAVRRWRVTAVNLSHLLFYIKRKLRTQSTHWQNLHSVLLSVWNRRSTLWSSSVLHSGLLTVKKLIHYNLQFCLLL